MSRRLSASARKRWTAWLFEGKVRRTRGAFDRMVKDGVVRKLDPATVTASPPRGMSWRLAEIRRLAQRRP